MGKVEKHDFKTTGEAAAKAKLSNEHTSVLEMQEAVHSGAHGNSYEDELNATIKSGLKAYDRQPFFVVVLFRRERTMDNVVRNQFLHRRSCPSPEYDQTVYRFDPANSEPEFIWVIPNRMICEQFMSNKSVVVPEEWPLLKMIEDMYDGSLLRKAKKLNGELVA